MAVHLITVTLDHDSAMPEDQMVNTFHFEGDSTVPVLQNAFDMVEDFYTVIPTGSGQAVAAFLSSQLAGTGTLRAYNLEDPEPRVPVDERDFTFTPGTNALPSEIATVLSFQAPPVSGVNQARRRNRVYIGPCSQSSFTGSGTPADVGRPTIAFRTAIAGSARDMKAASDASINMKWVVYSPTIAAVSGVAAAFAEVTDGWVDNSADVQRRRGEAPTSRLLFTATTP